MSTPVSGSAAYCTPAQMVVRYDQRTIGQLLSDTDVPLSAAEVLASTKLETLLKQASGLVETAVLTGGMYTVADLGILNGNSAEFLTGLVADIAMFLTWNRRPSRDRKADMPAQVELAFEWLEKLADGSRILALAEHAAAGVVTHHVETSADVDHRRGTAVVASRFFGRRSNQLND